MDNMAVRLCQLVETQRDRMWAAEKQIWENPETGYKEWKTQAYLKQQLENLGYSITEAGDIPGFYSDLDTGRPGPMIVLIAEMDSIINFSHPACNPQTGAVHACCHHAQCASLLGAAAVFKTPGALDGMSGIIRLMFVPAEELLDIEYKEDLLQKGIIRYFGGKVECMRRGWFNGASTCLMLHTESGRGNFILNPGFNGCLVKSVAYHGLSTHAALPYNAINSLYAANLGLNAINAIRETFHENDHVRVHPIFTGRVGAVNNIPDLTTIETQVRACKIDMLKEINHRVNRALVGSAAAMGCTIEIRDRPGYSPVNNDKNLYQLVKKVMVDLVGEENIEEVPDLINGCTDMGNVSCVFPAIHPNVGGWTGSSHQADCHVADKETALVLAAKFFCCVSHALLKDEGAAARYIDENKKTLYNSVEEYLAVWDSFYADINGVTYTEKGAELNW